MAYLLDTSILVRLANSADAFHSVAANAVLVLQQHVIGKQVHDARLVAVCHVHSINQLLTFNGSHFVRMAGVGPGLVVVDPANV